MRVLVVDDEPSLREVVAEYLATEGFEATVAADGREALELLPSVRPDLVMLDLMMPRLDGRGFLEHLQDMDGLAQTPVLVITAGAIDPAVLAFPNVRALLSKPFDFGEIVNHVESAVQARTREAA